MKKIIFFLIFIHAIFSQAITLKELDELKRRQLLDLDTYNFMVAELDRKQTPTLKMYSLFIGDDIRENLFPIIEYKEDVYINIKAFFDSVGITYTIKDEKFIVQLNSSFSTMDKKTIDLKDEENILKKDDDFYIKESLFKKEFCSSLEIKKNTIKASVNFKTKNQMEKYFTVLENKTKENQNKKEKGYTYIEKPKFIDLGVIEPVLYKDLNTSMWRGEIKYNSDFLFGDLETNYDIKTKRLKETSLKYNYLLKDHEIEIYNKDYSAFNKKYGLEIYKDKGYFSRGNYTYIKEDVPQGSKVELIYHNKTIDIQTENNGKVYFYGPLIKRGSSYTLIVHTPSGDIYTKKIKIVDRYNLQDKKKFDYNLQIEKNVVSQEISERGNFYYGLTDNLTLGVKNSNLKEKKYLGGNVIVGDNFGALSYIVNFESLRNTEVKDEYIDTVSGKLNYESLENRFEIKKDHLSLNNIKKYKSFDSRYYLDSNRDFYIGGIFKETENRRNKTKYLTPTYGFKIPLKGYNIHFFGDKDEIRNIITTSYKNHFFHLTQKYNKKKDDYKVEFEVSNYSMRLFNYRFGVSYSEKQKECYSFSFNATYDTWLKFRSAFNTNSKKYNSSIEMNKAFDLSSMSSQNPNSIKVIPFLDKNKNGIKDKDEEFFNNVGVKINGKSKIIIDDTPEYFSGISKNQEYIMEITVRSYGYKAKEPKMKILKNTKKIMNVYIPIEEI